MTIVEWAEAVLPLLALGWGLCVVTTHAEVIHAWLARLDAWWADHLGKPKG